MSAEVGVRSFYGGGGCRYRRHVDLLRVASAACRG
ncbi:putative leader peptide [Pseudonocardia acaciae]